MSGGSFFTRIPRLARGAAGVAGMVAVAAVVAVGGCSSAATQSAGAAGGPAASSAASAAGIQACGSGQWTFGKPVPEGDGPVFYVPVQVLYRSGPRCRLDITLTARLTDASGRLVPGGSATGVMRAVIGPAAGERATPLTSMPRSSFLWFNWCGPAGGVIHSVVTGPGHVSTTDITERPMCVHPGRPISFTWG